MSIDCNQVDWISFNLNITDYCFLKMLESPKYRHPAIRRASWNPDAENVAGKAFTKQPRKGFHFV